VALEGSDAWSETVVSLKQARNHPPGKRWAVLLAGPPLTAFSPKHLLEELFLPLKEVFRELLLGSMTRAVAVASALTSASSVITNGLPSLSTAIR
jgi:hypothetical protein